MSETQAIKIGPDEIATISLNPLKRGGCVAIVTTGSGERWFIRIGFSPRPSMLGIVSEWWRTYRDLFQPIEQWPYQPSDMVNGDTVY